MLFLSFFANAVVFLKLLKTFFGEGQARMHMDRGQLLVLSFFHRSSREKLRLSGLVVHSLYWLSLLRFVNYVHVCQWECACISAGTVRV